MQVALTTSHTSIPTADNYHVVNTSYMLSSFISLPMRCSYQYALFLDGEGQTQKGKVVHLRSHS